MFFVCKFLKINRNFLVFERPEKCCGFFKNLLFFFKVGLQPPKVILLYHVLKFPISNTIIYYKIRR